MRYFSTISFLLVTTRFVQAQPLPLTPEYAATQRATPPADTSLVLQGQRQPARPFLTVQDQLRTVAGVQVTPYDGSPGSGELVRIRGAAQALGRSQGTTQPLYVIDGLPALNSELTPDQLLGPQAPLLPTGGTSNSSLGYYLPEDHLEAGTNPLQLLTPEAITSIEVLAGPAAVARYGPLGANGVISIRTRRGAGAPGRPLHVTYAAYGGVQLLRHRYSLLEAPEYANVVNEAAQRRGERSPFAQLPTAAGTDWQAELYRPAGLQQHQLSLSGQHHQTNFLVSADFRQQAGLLRHSQLTRYGLRLALDQRLGSRLTLQGTVLLGATTQTLPFAASSAASTTLAALLAPPTAPVRTAQGDYNTASPVAGTTFLNPLLLADTRYRQPNTRRLLTQLGATYQLGTHLTAQASANFERTLLATDSYWRPLLATYQPGPVSRYGHQTYHGSQWVAQLTLRYQRRLGAHHQLEAGLDYSLQGAYYDSKITYSFSEPGLDPSGTPASPTTPWGYVAYEAQLKTLHRPWGRLAYRLDSTLTVEVALGTVRFKDSPQTGYYPSAQVSWHPQLTALGEPGLAPTLWLGAARTSLLNFGYGYGGPAPLSTPFQVSPSGQYSYRQQAPYYTDQLEAGLRLGAPTSHFSAQLAAYTRLSYHVLLYRSFTVFNNVGFFIDEATSRNQGLELTLTGNWQAGPVLGTTRLVASANRNRLQGDEYAIDASHFPQTDNQLGGAFYGYQQDGLKADGSVRYATLTSGGTAYNQALVLGSGIPSQLLGLSQQLDWGRFTLDAQLDAMLGYQVANYQLPALDTPSGFTNNATSVRNRWTPTNSDTNIPAAGTYDYNYANFGTDLVTSRLLENGSHLRLTSLTASYRLRHTGSQNLSVWVGGQNLLVLTSYRGYDPNVSSGGSSPALAGRDYGAVPVPRVWLLGVRAAL